MAVSYEQQLDQLDQSTLAKAFRGELVPQDPSDEPASVLLARIREQRAQQAEAAKRNKKTSQSQRRNKTGKKSSKLTPQQLMLAEIL
jgi:type I restriction enzyme S subunit